MVVLRIAIYCVKSVLIMFISLLTGVSGMNYHLDANLLKQKLLNTGLVEEDAKPEVVMLQ